MFRALIQTLWTPALLLILLYSLLSISPKEVIALDQNRLITQYIHDSWRTDAGLPGNEIRSVIQSRDGYIWIATAKGLVRFDGVTFTRFSPSEKMQTKAIYPTTMFEDQERNLWIGSWGVGLFKLRDGEFTRYTKRDGLPSYVVFTFCEDKENNLWIGTEEGLVRSKDGKFYTYTTKDGLSNNNIRALYLDRNGGLWIGTWGGGLNYFKDNRFTIYRSQDWGADYYLSTNNLSGGIVFAIAEDHEGNIWVGTEGGGLIKIRDGKFTVYTTKDGLSNNIIRSLHVDRHNNLWIGTEGGGLCRFTKGSFSSYTTSNGLSDDIVQSIYEDREGSLWVGTYNGLDRFKDSKVKVYSKQEGLANDFTYSVHQAKDGSIWIGTRNGLTQLREGRFKNYTVEDGLASNLIYSIYEDEDRTLWFGTRSGLSRFKEGHFKNYTLKDGLTGEVIGAIYRDRKGNLWVGARTKGLNLMKNGKFIPYSFKDSPLNRTITSIYEDIDGALWFSTETDGLYQLQDGKTTLYTTENGLISNSIRSIYQDRYGVIWIGTYDGLSRFEDGKFINYTNKDGLTSNVILALTEDNNGNFWIAYDEGIFSISRKDLELFAQGEISSIKCSAYSTTDGMKSNEIVPSYSRSKITKTNTGTLLFATTKGVVEIDPLNIRINREIPPVIIEEIKINSNTVNPNIYLESPLGSGEIQLKYTALSTLFPERVLFKYKLEGFDQDWTNATTKREAHYTNLPPGAYRFRVIACNNDGIWNTDGDSFDFYLKPPFYRTYWFYALSLLILILVTIWLIRLRMHKVRVEYSAVLAERSRIARELHDTLEQKLAGITWQLDTALVKLHETPHLIVGYLETARYMLRSAMMEARHSVWELRSSALENGDLLTALTVIAKEITAGTNVSAHVEIEGEKQKLPAIIEHHLLRIGQEAITNAIKHSKATDLYIRLIFENRYVILIIKDNGVGFDLDLRANAFSIGHFGLIGMEERAEKIGGDIKVSSQSMMGTEISVRVPVN
jgi:ligand-binding sensor domain-containing protein/signal transduction histidine kinase